MSQTASQWFAERSVIVQPSSGSTGLAALNDDGRPSIQTRFSPAAGAVDIDAGAVAAQCGGDLGHDRAPGKLGPGFGPDLDIELIAGDGRAAQDEIAEALVPVGEAVKGRKHRIARNRAARHRQKAVAIAGLINKTTDDFSTVVDAGSLGVASARHV